MDRAIRIGRTPNHALLLAEVTAPTADCSLFFQHFQYASGKYNLFIEHIHLAQLALFPGFPLPGPCKEEKSLKKSLASAEKSMQGAPLITVSTVDPAYCSH